MISLLTSSGRNRPAAGLNTGIEWRDTLALRAEAARSRAQSPSILHWARALRRKPHFLRVFSLSVIGCSLMTTAAIAQTIATLDISPSMINAGVESDCKPEWHPTQSSNSAPPDTLIVRIGENGILAASASALAVLFNGTQRAIIPAGRRIDTIALEPADLTNAKVALRRTDASADHLLCVHTVRTIMRTQLREDGQVTSFIADGAIGTGLRTGIGTSTLTGSLGILHVSKKEPGSFHFPGLKTASGERLKTVIALASSVDTLISNEQISFIQSVASPSFAGGQVGSGSIDYYVFEPRGGATGTQGFHLLFQVHRAEWRHSDPRPAFASDTLSRHITLLSLDTRWRWAFIDRQDDPKQNDFLFALELGPALRWLPGATASDDRFKILTLGTTRSFFPGGVLAFQIQLRQVTASVELPFFVDLMHQFQPAIGFQFDAPFFTF